MFPGSNAIYSTKCASVLPTIHRWYHRVIVFVQVKRSRLSNLPWVIQLLCSTANTIPVSQCLYFIHQLSSGKSQVVCIGQDNSKRLISKQTNKQSNGANVFFFFFQSSFNPLPPFQDYRNSKFTLMTQFTLPLWKKQVRTQESQGIQGQGNRNHLSSTRGGLGCVLLNSACQELHFSQELSVPSPFTWLPCTLLHQSGMILAHGDGS